MATPWWTQAVIYQIYPRSFKDGNGDGVGDLRGIIEKLDYIKSLGVDAVWLNPIYRSPGVDGGYDISDYRAIDPQFGTMDDFDELLRGMHKRGIRLIMDIVVNHTSDQHPWFKESRKSVDNPYRSYYFWRKGKDDGPPNNWLSFFGGSAWQFDEPTGEYYLHLFSKEQPDINWENPAVRNEFKELMMFWLNKGVDGLRLDVITAISKRTDFPDSDTTDFNKTIERYYANGPRLKEFILEMREQVWNKFGCLTIGEGPGITPANAMDYIRPGYGLDMIFHFGHMFLDQGPGGRFDPVPWTLPEFKKLFATWDEALANGWGSIFLGNHDFARMVSRWGNDGTYHRQSAKLLLTLLLTMRGTPFIYQGDEIGMTNLVLNSIEEAVDVESRNSYEVARLAGKSEPEFLQSINYSGRDNARTPVQWDGSTYAGFSEYKPWMRINPNSVHINVDTEEADPDSILNYFRALLHLRKSTPALIGGKFDLVYPDDPLLFAYYRTLQKQKFFIALNFSDNEIAVPPSKGNVLIGNYPPKHELSTLRPWEALVIQL
ncbi:MAG: alpha-glucosidase [Flammeovirgaceae bacterium]|nr:MAG: alpha-glucosidase [Flammeovirgaceae bacterium]